MAKSVAEIQARARLLHEKDRLSMREIGLRVGKAERTIANWAERGLPDPEKGPWVKGSFAGKVQEKVEEANLAMAIKKGMGYEYFLDRVKMLCEATRPVLVKGDNEDEAKEEGDESGGAFVQEIPDYKAIDAGLTHAERIIPGLKAQEKTGDIDNLAESIMAFVRGEK